MPLNNKRILAATTLAILMPLELMAETTEARVERLEAELQTLQEQLNATADAIEGSEGESHSRVGGYGELHYNDIDGKDAVFDFHRFVLFFAHDFSEDIRFFSELELEHALAGDGDEKPGEIELEQAYIEFDVNNQTQAKAGVFLLPIGILNETHEPPTFYGVERNPVEKNIIPATWWEPGGSLSGQKGSSGLSYDLAIHGGLKVDPDKVTIRGGRQKAAKAIAESLALTGRLKYTGIPGLELAGSINVQDDISQADGDDLEDAILASVHAIWNKGPVGLRALYATWDIDGKAATLANKDKQDGYYLEVSYKFSPKFGLFTRTNAWSIEKGVDAQQLDLGFNWWPHENVVLKADIQRQNEDAGDADGFNLGVGYQF